MPISRSRHALGALAMLACAGLAHAVTDELPPRLDSVLAPHTVVAVQTRFKLQDAEQSKSNGALVLRAFA